MYKWFKVEVYPDEDCEIYRSDDYGICRACFLAAMGVKPNGNSTDARKVQKVSTDEPKPVRPRRTPVTRADIDRYRRSAGADRSGKRPTADREGGEQVQEGSRINWREPIEVHTAEHGKLSSTKKRKANPSRNKKVS